MRIGLQVPNFTFPESPASIRPLLKDIAQFVDTSGFYSLWVMDHFFQIRGIGVPEQEMLESYSTLSYFAALTQNVKLGALVTAVIYRYPGVLLKTVTTLDVLSGGRAYLGIGAAWFEGEALALGIPYPPTKERFERLEETLRLVHQAWDGDQQPYSGKHYRLERPMLSPMPISQPHPPIMIGGGGEQKTLRLVAQYADACNLLISLPQDVLRQKLDILKSHCDAVGRDYDSIEKTALGTIDPVMTAGDIIQIFKDVKGLGFTHLIFNTPEVENFKILNMLAKEVVPEISGL